MCLILCFYFDFLFPTNCQLYLLFTDLVSYHIVNIFGLQHMQAKNNDTIDSVGTLYNMQNKTLQAREYIL